MQSLFNNRILTPYFKFIKQGPNLRYYHAIDTLQTKTRPLSEEFLLANDIVKKAIHKFAPDELKHKVFNGYRRSDGSDQAAEKNFLQADLPYRPVTKDEHYQRALRVTEKLFRPSQKLRPVSFPDLRYYPWTLPTSAEAPFTIKQRWKEHTKAKHSLGITDDPRLNFHNLYNEIFIKNRDLVHLIKHKEPKFFSSNGEPIPYYWHSLHTRAHLVKETDPDKNRAVFGTPKLLLMTENMFLWPLQKEYLNRKIESPLLWGFETFKGGWNKLYNSINTKGSHKTYLGIDWRGFDRRAKFEVIDDVHNIWRSYFDFDKGYEPTNLYPNAETSESKIQNLWSWMTYSVKYTPIRAISGNFYQFTHSGIASGYQQTQLLDSFVNTIMILTCLSSLGINIEAEEFILYVQGDDSLVCFYERIFDIFGNYFLTMLAEKAKFYFDAELNVEKSTISNTLNGIEVLSYKNRNGIAYRDEAELLAQLLYPERSYRTLGATASAAVGIAMASMGNSKILYKICYDIWNHIINDLKAPPKPTNLTRWMNEVVNIRISGKEFPSLLEIKDQQFFWNKERTQADKQRLWPSDQSQEFYFLRS